MSDLQQPFHALLSGHMAAGALTAEALASEMGVAIGTVRRWLNGQAVPQPAMYRALTRLLFGDPNASGPEAAALRAAWERGRSRKGAIPAIPPQQPGPHFAIGPNGLIRQVPPTDLDPDGNNTKRIDDLLPLARQAADALCARIGPDHNTFGDLGRLLAQYRSAIAPGDRPISWGYVWGLGLTLEDMAAAVERPIERMQDALEDTDHAALQTLRTLHGPLILSTAEGRELQAQADRNRMTRADQDARRADAIAVAAAFEDLTEPDTLLVVRQAAAGMGQGRHPERGTEYGLATLGNLAIVGIVAAVVAVSAPFGLGQVAWEVAKNTPFVAAAIKELGADVQGILDAGGAQARQMRMGLALYWEAVLGVKERFRSFTGRWANAYLDRIGEPRASVDPTPSWDAWFGKPDWADTIGRDKYGVFVTIEVPALRGKPVTQTLRWIPPGTFLMGSADDDPVAFDNERPQHLVQIRQGFWLFDTPCTQALWTAVMGDNPSRFNGRERPVEMVSWEDAQRFLSRLDRRFGLTLPSETQWEYACRAGPREAPELDEVAWFWDNSGLRTHDVATKKRNEFGLYDMLGNVWEWCKDDWHDSYEGAPVDDTAWVSMGAAARVLRGGCWVDGARHARAACRLQSDLSGKYHNVGFRCARV